MVNNWKKDKLIHNVDDIQTGKSFFSKEKNTGNLRYPILGSTGIIGFDETFDYSGDFILTARVGANAGNVYKYSGKVKISDNTIFIQVSKKCEFIYYLLVYFNLKKLAFGTGQPLIKASTLKELDFEFPPLTEQKKISESLSDIDKLINSLSELMKKKRLIKKGTMQEFFSRKTSLKEYNNQWLTKTMGELFEISGGLNITRAELSNEGIDYLHYGDIHSSKKTYIDLKKNDLPKLEVDFTKVTKSAKLKNGDVIFVDASEDVDGASKFVVIRNKENQPLISGLHTIIASPIGQELDDLFKEYIFQSEEIKQEFRFYSAGTKVTGVSKKNIAKISVSFPKDKSEQNEIATILSEMDEEIFKLEEKLEKYKKIKQGMMEQLLTGKIRLA